MGADPSLPLVVGAGLLAFVSPCFLPLVPVMVTYLAQDAAGEPTRWHSVRQACLFVAGFTAIFVLLWSVLATLGPILAPARVPIRIAAGALIIVFGFHAAGLIRVPVLERTFRTDVRPRSHRTPAWQAFVLGAAFGCGWTPCIGPVLGAVIALAAESGSFARGTLLLVVFSASMGLPFIAIAAGVNAFTPVTAWLKRHYTAVSVATGLLLVVTGFLIMTDMLTTISGWLPA